MQKKIDTVLIGGTFNPVHLGHLHLIEAIESEITTKRIIIIPSFISAHKINKPVLSEEHRIEMLKKSFKNKKIIIEECELKRKGISYSIDTLRYLVKKYNLTEKPGFVIGDDLINGFETWKNVEELSKETQLIVVARNKKNHLKLKYDHICLNNKMKKVSSSEIRKRLKTGLPCEHLLPKEVYIYIKAKSLYGVNNV